MSTVGRIGWIRSLTKVLTRSRGTPAAAFAMYCSRKVLVDTELGDYTTGARGGRSSYLPEKRTGGRPKSAAREASKQRVERAYCCGAAPGNAGRAALESHTFLTMMRGTVASWSPARPGGAPTYATSGFGSYPRGALPVETAWL